MPSRRTQQLPSDVCAIGKQFFQYVNRSGNLAVTDKEALRSLYYQEFKPSLTVRDVKVCNFSTMIYYMKQSKMIRVKNGSIDQQKAYASVTLDQYSTMRRAEQDERGPGAGQRHTSQQKTYPHLCGWCGVYVNSEKSLKEHIRGKRHRVNMLKKSINSKREDLVQNKNGVTINTGYDDAKGNVVTQMQRGENGEITFIIRATGDREIALNYIILLRRREQFVVLDDHDVYSDANRYTLLPGQKYRVKLTCSDLASLGRRSSPMVFGFQLEDTEEIFNIMRFVSITVVSDVNDDLPPSKPYTKPPRFTAREKKGEIVDGVRPENSHVNPLKGKKLEDYFIPTALNKAVNSKGKLLIQLRQKLEQPLTADNHREKFHTLLHVEELQMLVDIRRYDRHGQKFTRSVGGALRLHVPGLAENRPSVLRGDHLYARFSDKSDDKSYKGYVHSVELEDLVLRFAAQFMNKYVDGMKFDIQFTFNRYAICHNHNAVDMATGAGGLDDVIFPEMRTIGIKGQPTGLQQIMSLKMFDAKLSRNDEQVQAVHNIVMGTSRPAPYLVFGPPGTGKTVTIVEAAKQVYQLMPESRILVSAPSNDAADLVAVRLLSNGTPVIQTHLLRFYAPSRPLISINAVLKEKKCCNLRTVEKIPQLYVPSREEIISKRIIVTTLVTAGRLALAQFPKNFFTHVFIDEAGHAAEPEALIALSGLLNPENPDGGQVVLAGDPKQLGPVLRSPLSIEYGLALSFLERLMTQSPVYSRGGGDGAAAVESYNPRLLTKLLRNYRSHPDILKLPNQLFYDNELQVFADKLVRESFCAWDELPKQGFPVIFHGVEGQDEREEQSPSFFNKSEVEIVVDYVRKVMERRGGQKIKEDDIGVISPYRKQVQKLRQVLKKRRYENIKVGSVEEFQGQERLVIIISTVRSPKAEYIEMDINYKLGFLKNPKRFNVAVTRAKALLIIVGNPFMLSKDENWNQMLEFCCQNGGYRGCPYSSDEQDVDDIIDMLQKTHLGHLPTEEEAEEELQISHVTQQNDPEWRSEV